ncbi:MAG: hypothetical protein OEX81_01890 [Candidatus Pacebacteria bacterium]|nr:hypothetical protein [Candidatus Paceibacterota bacterium]
MKFNIKNLNKVDLIKIGLPFLFASLHYLRRGSLNESIFYVLGWFAGIVLMYLDKNQLYKYYYESIHLKDDKFARLVTRSILFIISYFGLSLFLITSSGSDLGMGIVMGIGLILGLEMWHSRSYVEFFNQYFIQSKKLWNKYDIDLLIKVFWSFYLFISIFSVI